MKVALTSRGDNLEVLMDSRFGRAANFLIWDASSGEVEVLANTQNLQAAQGAGIQAAMLVVESGAKAVITGHCGPKAFHVLQEAGVKVYLTKALTGQEAIKLFQAGELKEADVADVEGHWV
jgi:predicted Fe-Mo cluster-binding NifX family protein